MPDENNCSSDFSQTLGGVVQGTKADVLKCLANLSNEEVFTPPEVANQMLDLLPKELWKDPNAKFLDPACKSGVFLREIAKRLIEGLKEFEPDLEKRHEHIFKNQLYAISITELTGLISRRSVYCSKCANSKWSVVTFRSPEGNIHFHTVQHDWEGGRCKYCGASQQEYQRDSSLETHAYEFIHPNWDKEFQNMRFDVIISNPPYQLSTNNNGIQAIPVYDKFIQKAKEMKPRYITMIVPARWYAGGMGMNEFRESMLNDKHILYLHDYPKSRECFSGVDIAGGVCYFLWARDKQDICTVEEQIGNKISSFKRSLNEFPIFVRSNIGVKIVRKTLSHHESLLEELVYPISPFGLATCVRGNERKYDNCVTLVSSKGQSYIGREIVKNEKLLGQWKVTIGQLNPDRGGVNNASDGKMNVTTKVSIYGPDVATTATYLVLGGFDSNAEAVNFSSYIKTKFVRFLISLTLSSMHITKANFCFVPVQDFGKPWTDAELYAKYGLTEEEITFIESMIRPMD